MAQPEPFRYAVLDELVSGSETLIVDAAFVLHPRQISQSAGFDGVA
jgi:hypothetical protein